MNCLSCSGKTSTIELIAKELASKRIQVLTYNRLLSHDTEKRLRPFGEMVSVNTFHSFVGRHYHYPTPTDIELEKFHKEPVSCDKESIPPVDILILDEAQDLDPLLYKTVLRICSDVGTHPLLVILGDEKQVSS